MEKIPNIRQLIGDEVERRLRRRQPAAVPNTTRTGGSVTVPGSTEVTDDHILSVVQPGTHLYGESSAGSDAYAVTLEPAITELTAGMIVHVLADVGNTGAATLDVNGIGAADILKAHDQPLTTGDIEAGQLVTVAWDGTNWQMQSQTAQTAGTGADIVARRRSWLGL